MKTNAIPWRNIGKVIEGPTQSMNAQGINGKLRTHVNIYDNQGNSMKYLPTEIKNHENNEHHWAWTNINDHISRKTIENSKQNSTRIHLRKWKLTRLMGKLLKSMKSRKSAKMNGNRRTSKDINEHRWTSKINEGPRKSILRKLMKTTNIYEDQWKSMKI